MINDNLVDYISKKEGVSINDDPSSFMVSLKHPQFR